MNSDKTDKRIKELVVEHDARKPLLPPTARAAAWTGLALLAAVVLFSIVQPFRTGLASHLIENPLLLLEMISAVLFIYLGAAWAFRSAVPGLSTPRWIKFILAFSAVSFGTSVALSFSAFGAESTQHGGRGFCWLEVIICGLITFTAIVMLLRRSYPRFTWHHVLLLAVIAALPGGAMMQLACAYNPEHGLHFHYLPVLAFALVGLSIQRLLRR